MPQPGSFSLNHIEIRSPLKENEWEAYYHLRWQVLREPWKQPPGTERDELDETSFHLMAVNTDNKVIGVGRLHMSDTELAQIRYMAVDGEFQRSGIGKRILQALEEKAIKLGAKQVFLNARDTHLAFYTKLGYRLLGPDHVLYNTITHTRVIKHLVKEK